tara:strand:+ start:969 stop:2237 length:1269 start_codon:yes stop_codon:yes gene_type:complete
MSGQIYVAFDLGSFSIKGAMAKVNQDKELEILSIKSIKSRAVECGTIVDKEQLVNDLDFLIKFIEDESGHNIKEAIVSVSGNTVKSVNSSTRSRIKDSTDFKIDKETVNKILAQCSDLQISAGRQVVHNIERGFIIDGSPLIRNPINNIGEIIEARSHVVHVQDFNLNQIKTCFDDDFSIEVDAVFDGLASSYANVSEDDKDLGVVFVDIGSDKTNVVIYKDRYIMHSKVIPIGSHSVTKDLATMFNVSIDDSEEVKRKHVSALSKLADIASNFELSISEDTLKKQLNQKEVSEVAEARFKDIIDKVRNEIRITGEKISEFGSGIKITGGGSNVKNLDLLFKEYLEDLESENPENKDISIKCEYLPIKDITFKENLEDRREYATLIGLLKWPVLNVEKDDPLIGVKKSFTENFSNIWKGFFE